MMRRSPAGKALRHLCLASCAMLMALPPFMVHADCEVTSVGFTPLNDLGSGQYLGLQGGLYPGGSNSRPAVHESAGLELAGNITPLDVSGSPDNSGRYVLLSIGMSNATLEFQAFAEIASADPDKDPALVIVDGAQGGKNASDIIDPRDSFWGEIENRLSQAGVTPAQVAVAWIKEANPAGGVTAQAYREELQANLEEIARILMDKYPNIKLAYYSSRIYGGYASTNLNPEPYAYESGFSVKGAIETQLDGDVSLNFDPARGAANAPWLSWGPYLWADGLIPRGDGLTWECREFQRDGTHPSDGGAQKVAGMLLDFFKSDTTAREWFLADPGTIDVIAPAAPTDLIAE